MADNTKIEWADHTFNPWEGCQKVGPGCDHCYAETRNARYNGTAINWGPDAPRRRTSAANWKKPLKWNLDAANFAALHKRRQRVFCASLADVFDNAVPWQWRLDLFSVIADTPELDWLLLTKRIGNVQSMLDDMQVHGTLAECFPNVWLGITVVNQDEADRDIPKLQMIPAAVRWLSCEPLLGALDLSDSLHGQVTVGAVNGIGGVSFGAPAIDWVVAGGESGPGARPMHPDWARSLRDQCAAAGVPFFFKQWGDHFPCELLPDQGDGHPWRTMHTGGPAWALAEFGLPRSDIEQVSFSRVGKKRAGRQLDGVRHDAMPEVTS